MNQSKILIVDDDPNIREVLSVLLGSEGYIVSQAEDGTAALEIIHDDKDIDLVILDIMMPGMSGVEVCARIREKSKVPVLFLTAKSQEQDKVDAYTEGGDDYLVKPFSQTELLMKVKSQLRRYTEYQGKAVPKAVPTIGGVISIDAKTRSAIKGDKRIPLTDKEYDILQYFMEHRGEIVENKSLYEGVWNEKYLPSAGNTIMVHVLNLRKKLEEDANNPKLIKTVWGKGYRVE
ncbi:response regulator transcription factor [Ihubacter sp. rT4E-8]|uniref:response regulator transcription factor n=1 Tax=unclassified Ihubacter TaxID=2633299 RepID=UPI00137A0D46